MLYNILNNCLNFSVRETEAEQGRAGLCRPPRVLAKGFVLQDAKPALSVREKPVSSLQSVKLVLDGVPGLEPEGSAACKMPDPWVRGGGRTENAAVPTQQILTSVSFQRHGEDGSGL